MKEELKILLEDLDKTLEAQGHDFDPTLYEVFRTGCKIMDQLTISNPTNVRYIATKLLRMKERLTLTGYPHIYLAVNKLYNNASKFYL